VPLVSSVEIVATCGSFYGVAGPQQMPASKNLKVARRRPQASSALGRLLLLPDPRNVPADGFIGQEQLFRVVLLGQFLFVGDEVMDASMTSLANHEASLVHLLFAEAVLEALFSMNPSGDQVMLR